MQVSSLLLQLSLHDLLGIVPCAAGVCHEDGLIQAKCGNRDQVSNEEEWLHESESQRGEEHRNKDVQHSFLCILRANRDHPFAVAYRCLFDALKLNIRCDELNRAIGTGGNGLGGSTCEPINNCAAADQA